MTPKEAIQRILRHIEVHRRKEPNAIFITKALQIAIVALEKQIPKKPNIWGDGYDNKGNLIYDMYDCPNCSKSYEIDYEKYDYCPICGQALDWSGSDG